MEKTSGISSSNYIIKSSTNGAGGKNIYYHQPQKGPNPGAKVLRIGEIIRGEVIDAKQLNIATVRLPNGTFSAELKGNLNKGDVIFFQVIDNEPSLVLKIHSLPVRVSGELIDNTDILRILNIPHDNFTNQLIEHFKKNRSIIIKDESFAVYTDYYKLNRQSVKNKSTEHILELLLTMQAASMPVSNDLFEKLYPGFISHLIVSQSLDLLKEMMFGLHEEFSAKLKMIYAALFNKEAGKKYYSMIFSTNIHAKEPSLYSLFRNMMRHRNKGGTFARAAMIAGRAADAIESIYLWNSINLINGGSIWFLLPEIYQGKLNIKRVEVKLDKNIASQTSFSIDRVSEKYGKITASGNIKHDGLYLDIYTSNNSANEQLKNHYVKLYNNLLDKPQPVKSLKVMNIENNNSPLGKSGSDFSIVV